MILGLCRHEVRCGVPYASFLKVTLADLKASGSEETGVMESETIFPLWKGGKIGVSWIAGSSTYQKLKKSRTSFSEVVDEMPET